MDISRTVKIISPRGKTISKGKDSEINVVWWGGVGGIKKVKEKGRGKILVHEFNVLLFPVASKCCCYL